MIKFNLKRAARRALLEIIHDLSYSQYMKKVTFDDLMPSIIRAFDDLDQTRDKNGESKKYYVLTLKKFWKKYGHLPEIIQIDKNDLKQFLNTLLGTVNIFLTELDQGNFQGLLDCYKWDGRYITIEEKIERRINFMTNCKRSEILSE